MKHPAEAAIRLPCGRVFVGNFHGHALELASAAGYADSILLKSELGFSHSDGSAFYEAQTTPLL